MKAKLKCMVFPESGIIAMGQPFPTVYTQATNGDPIMFHVNNIENINFLASDQGFFRLALLNVNILAIDGDSVLVAGDFTQFIVNRNLLEQIEE